MFDARQIQKIQKDLQDRMEKIQEELARRSVEGTSGGGIVTVVANGQQELISVKIQPDAVDPKDIEMLEDLFLAAANQALGKAKEMHESMVGQVTGGVKIPGLF